MAREALKDNILDSLQLLIEVSVHLKGFNEGRYDMYHLLENLNRRFNDFGYIGESRNIIKLRDEVVQHFIGGIKIMTTEEMNKEYRQACIDAMKRDLANEFEKVIDSESISNENKEWAFSMAMSALKQINKV